MISAWLQKLKPIFVAGLAQVQEFISQLPAIKQAIIANFGETGLAAISVVVLIILGLVVYKIISFGLKVLKYLVIPAVGLALLGAIVLPYSFLTILPITAAACSLLLLFKA